MENDKKEILVNGESLLMDIQEAFSVCYPYLLIEFFRQNRNLPMFRQTKMELLSTIKALADAAALHIIDVSGVRTVAEVSDDIARITGVCVKFSRKSGGVWNVISLTGGWTLERQNAAGQYISELMGNKGK